MRNEIVAVQNRSGVDDQHLTPALSPLLSTSQRGEGDENKGSVLRTTENGAVLADGVRQVRPTVDLEYSPSELYPEVARSRLISAVENCARIKEAATQRAAAVAGYRPELLKVAIVRVAASVARSDAMVGRRHAAKVHPEWTGLTQREYTTKISQVRRSQLYAMGLTSRGTVRVKKVEGDNVLRVERRNAA